MSHAPADQNLVCSVSLGEWGGIGHWRGQLGSASAPETSSTEVFIKELLSEDRETARRFEHEGTVTARLNHAGVTKLLARHPRKHVFEWLPGESLRLLLDRQRTLPLPEALALLRELLHTLVYLHSEGVVHHDIKPENVMLPQGWPEVGQPVVLVDFGMAYDHQQPHDVHAGMRMGTPQFMPPEQFAGVRGDHRSDLYAAAALLFDTITGQPPYPNALGWLAGFDSTRLPLPEPAELQTLFETALQRDPAERVQTAAQMLSLLQGVLQSVSPSTGPVA